MSNFVFASVGLLLATLLSLINAQAPQTSFFPIAQPSTNNNVTELNIVGDGATRYFDVTSPVAPVLLSGIGFLFTGPSRTLEVSIYTRVGSAYGFEQNRTVWTRVVYANLTFAALSPAVQQTTALLSGTNNLDGLVAPLGLSSFVIPQSSTPTGIAVTLTDLSQSQLADTYMDSTNKSVSYQFMPAGNGFNVTMAASTMTDAPFSGTVLGYHEPWIALTVDTPNTLTVAATTPGNCSAPVAGQTTITFTTVVTNTGNEHLHRSMLDTRSIQPY